MWGTGLRGLDPIDKAVPMRVGCPIRTVALVAALGLVPAGAAGCDTLDDAQQVINRADLVNDLANRLDRSGELTYSAEYQLASGQTASVAQAQQPVVRTAYAYPGGKVIVERTATTECQARGAVASCTITPPPSPNGALPDSVLAAAQAQGLVPPRLVIGLLTAAALDTDAVIEQSDTTIAGQHATCVDVSGVENADAARFEACITTDGVLGSFSGTVSGQRVELSLVNYADAVPATAFDLPTGAKVTDQRPGQRPAK